MVLLDTYLKCWRLVSVKSLIFRCLAGLKRLYKRVCGSLQVLQLDHKTAATIYNSPTICKGQTSTRTKCGGNVAHPASPQFEDASSPLARALAVLPSIHGSQMHGLNQNLLRPTTRGTFVLCKSSKLDLLVNATTKYPSTWNTTQGLPEAQLVLKPH